MIEYRHTSKTNGAEVDVILDGDHIGTIRHTLAYANGGWRYFPKGQRAGGELFATLDACKRSLMEPKHNFYPVDTECPHCGVPLTGMNSNADECLHNPVNAQQLADRLRAK